MEQLKHIKKRLEDIVIEQMDDGIEKASTAEMGAVIDMIKDISKTMYNCALVKAMEESGAEYGVDFDYTGPYTKHAETDHTTRHDAQQDTHTGASVKSRAEYMKVRETGENGVKMHKLDEYGNSLHEDIFDMLKSASDNEKNLMRTKLQTIMQKL